jgi:hypothetical protein
VDAQPAVCADTGTPVRARLATVSTGMASAAAPSTRRSLLAMLSVPPSPGRKACAQGPAVLRTPAATPALSLPGAILTHIGSPVKPPEGAGRRPRTAILAAVVRYEFRDPPG